MAVEDQNYRYATQSYEADGVRTQYEVAFDGGYIRPEDVGAYSVQIDPETGMQTGRTYHPVVFVAETVNAQGWKVAQVSITPPVPAGRRVYILRNTYKRAPLVSYTNGSILTERNLDLSNEQAIFAIAEIMDGLNMARIDISSQVGEVLDLSEIVRELYTQVLELLASGGIVSVAPRVWSGVGSDGDTDFPLVGADVDASGFYDTYVAGVGLEPGTDYIILTGATPADTVIRFTSAPADGVRWFTVLRGYARPSTGPAPITSLASKIIDAPGPVYFVDKEAEFSVIRSTGSAPMSARVKEVPITGEPSSKLTDGSYFSVVQRGAGQVSIVADTANVTLVIPAGYVAKTRAMNSTISATCEYAEGNAWIISGDLAKE